MIKRLRTENKTTAIQEVKQARANTEAESVKVADIASVMRYCRTLEQRIDILEQYIGLK